MSRFDPVDDHANAIMWNAMGLVKLRTTRRSILANLGERWCLHCGANRAVETCIDGCPGETRLINSEASKPIDEPIKVTPYISMLLWCPSCGERHIDTGVFAEKPHHTHACQGCGMVWRPAIVNTCGVEFLPGFKNE